MRCRRSSGNLLPVVLSVLFAAAQSARAIDPDPFGLPAPKDSDHPGCVMLHGGGRSLSGKVRREFARLAGGSDARIVVIPSDSDERGKDEDGNPLPGGETVADYQRRMTREYSHWVELKSQGLIADLQFLDVSAAESGDLEPLYEQLEKATGVWIPAHDQERLPGLFSRRYPEQTSRFQAELRDVVARGGIVAGLSGGMACLPETIITGQEELRNGYGWKRARLGFGLALLQGVVVDQNFNAHTGRLERLTDLLRNGPRLDRSEGSPGVDSRTIGLGVEQATAVILQRNTIRAIGDGAAYLFLKSNGDRTITRTTLRAGDDPIILRSATAAEPKPPSDEPTWDDNPFGMPTPRNPNRWGTIVLHGGNDTTETIAAFPKLTGVASPKLVHCPASRESCRPAPGQSAEKLRAHLEQEFAEWRELEKKELIEKLTFLTTDNPADARRPEFIAPLEECDGCWFCGGDQGELARLFVNPWKPTLFQRELADIVQRGGVVGGSSAGLAILPDVMIEGGASDDGAPEEAELSRGFGLLRHVLAEQHFDTRAGRIERLTDLLRDHRKLANFAPTCQPKKLIGIAVEEDTALLIQGERIRVTGVKRAHLFLQGRNREQITWHALGPGDVAVVKNGTDGATLEIENWQLEP